MNSDGVVHGITKFADWAEEEFEKILSLPARTPEPEKVYKGLKAPKGERDWRDNKHHPIKDQGQCGSCWSFAATATIEFEASILAGKEIDVSEQELVNCATKAAGYSNNGCNGGWYDWAWNYVHDK